jgi:DMSO/TMAO reductase YedYZ molybdopterin-dependent catalytic subunit
MTGLDGYWTSLPLEDMLVPDVLLADHLDRKPVSAEHGAPLRLIAPHHYGYKSVEHLASIGLRRDAVPGLAGWKRASPRPRGAGGTRPDPAGLGLPVAVARGAARIRGVVPATVSSQQPATASTWAVVRPTVSMQATRPATRLTLPLTLSVRQH